MRNRNARRPLTWYQLVASWLLLAMGIVAVAIAVVGAIRNILA